MLRKFPWPIEHGAYLRHLNIVNRLQDQFIFDLYCYTELQDPPRELNAYFNKIIIAHDQGTEGKPNLNVLDSADTTSSFFGIRRKIETLLGSGRYAAAVVTVGGLKFLPRRGIVPVIGEIIDSDCLIIWRSLRHAKNLSQIYRSVRNLFVWGAYQWANFGRLYCVSYVSEVDATFSKRICPRPIHEVIPNGVDIEFFRPVEGFPEPFSLAFEGNMDFEPNVDAARYLIGEILPRIQASIPKAHLYLVGKNPHPDILAAAGPNITVTGFVPDIRPWLGRCRVFACPIRIGAGIKNKILQAWAMGIPTVASSTSVGGLKIADNQNILIRDHPDDFAEAVIAIFRDTALAQSVGRAGRATVEAHYTWDQCAAKFGNVLRRAIASEPAKSRSGDFRN